MRFKKYLELILEEDIILDQEFIKTEDEHKDLVSIIKKAQNNISYLKYYDSLTGLPNRALFMRVLDLAVSDAERNDEKICVMCLDVDRFKNINDTLGLNIGDLLLNEVSNRVAGVISKEDIVARVGEDEFALIISSIENDNAVIKIAEKLMDIFDTPYIIMEHQFYITASLGITIFPNDGQTAKSLIQNANIAMYKAKEFGKKNYQLFTKSMNEKAIRRLQIENNLRKAIENDELVLYYQPQIDAKSGGVVGSEALLRWRHPEEGMISPSEFIPVAEEAGLIIDIGEWVLRTACKQLKKWHKDGYINHRMAINISAKQFEQQNLVELIDSIIREIDIDPRFIELEITETSIMANIDRTTKILSKLRSRGMRISIDDFGTGFSSLGYIQRFSADILKIDQSFIHNISSSPENVAIITAIMDMAQALQLHVISEGVENEEQVIFLKSKNCNEFQGYFFSKPVPVCEFEKIMTNNYYQNINL